MLERQSGCTHAPRADAAKRADTRRIDGVGQDVETAELDQESDVVDEGERELPSLQAGGQRRAGAILHPLRPWSPLSRSVPAQEVAK